MSTHWSFALLDAVVVSLLLGDPPPRFWRIVMLVVFASAAILNALLALGVIHP